jgi:hypothetical protein
MSVDISSYTLSDLSGKAYKISSGTTIESHANLRLSYAQTKIVLNNTGNESVYIKNVDGQILDSYSYSGTQKDDVVLQISSRDEVCDILPPPSPSNTGITSTGSSST